MRHLKILLLNCEKITEQRARSFIWFLFSLIDPLVLLLFWRGASNTNSSTMSSITSYYFFLILASAILMSHIEEDVGIYDIKRGNLSKYLLKPFSYFWAKLYEEIPYRILKGIYGVIALSTLILFFGKFININLTASNILFGLLISLLAFFLSFIFKMIVGFLAFWTTDVRGIMETMVVFIIVFSSSVIPIPMMPSGVKEIATILPFSYMIYFPIAAFQGVLNIAELFRVITYQLVWIILFVYIYKLLWSKGVKKFTAFGQ